MENKNRKLGTTAVAIAACFAVPVVLVACGKFQNNSGEQKCTVSFDAGRGTIYGERFYEVDVEKGATVAQPSEAPVYDGYFFVGWNLTGDEDYQMWQFDSEKINNDITLHAVWVRGCTVTFDANGGTFEDGGDTYTASVAEGAKFTAPSVTPPNAMRTLKGWYHNYTAWDFDNDTTVFNITLTAEWDFTDEIKTSLAPFEYQERYDGTITVTGIKDGESVTAVTLPSIVSAIGDSAFMNCTELLSIVIPDSVTSIGERAFMGCENLKTVTLPSDLKELKWATFSDCVSLEAIDIPDTLNVLDMGVFMNCSSLEAIELPVGVVNIPSNTFRGCTALKDVKFGANVTQIGANAFTDCASLEAFEIPSGVTTLSGYVFSGCASLRSITVPATCTSIYQSAFRDSGLTSAVIHAKEIDFNAFKGCASLNSVTLGSEVVEIDSGAFDGCSSLTEIDVPDNVTSLAGAFANCTSLKSVSLGSGITQIAGSMFNGCSALRSVEIKGEITKIGANAFKDCVSLMSFTVPASLTDISSSAFDGCERLVEFYNLTDEPNFLNSAKPNWNTVVHTSEDEPSIIETVNGFSFCTFKRNYDSAATLYLLDYNGNSASVVLPDDFKGDGYKIFDYALSCNPAITSVAFSSGVTAVGENILFGSENVTSITANDNTAFNAVGNCLISIADKKFVLGCKTSVIPADGSVTTIGSYVFCQNSSIVNDAFVIPDSVTVVESSAFAGVDGIIRTAENGVQYVDKWVVGCYLEDSVSVSEISIELDAGTIGIGDSALSFNYSFRRKIVSVKTNAELKYIGDSALYSCDFVKTVTLNDGLLKIGHAAFGSCTRLEEIVIPDSVTAMGAAAFMNCKALTYVKLSSGLTEIEYQAFDECAALETVIIPENIKNIAHDVFGGDPTDLVVYYGGGDAATWNLITIQNGNNYVKTAQRYYYSDTEQEGFWHYDLDGKPTLW